MTYRYFGIRASQPLGMIRLNTETGHVDRVAWDQPEVVRMRTSTYSIAKITRDGIPEIFLFAPQLAAPESL